MQRAERAQLYAKGWRLAREAIAARAFHDCPALTAMALQTAQASGPCAALTAIVNQLGEQNGTVVPDVLKEGVLLLADCVEAYFAPDASPDTPDAAPSPVHRLMNRPIWFQDGESGPIRGGSTITIGNRTIRAGSLANALMQLGFVRAEESEAPAIELIHSKCEQLKDALRKLGPAVNMTPFHVLSRNIESVIIDYVTVRIETDRTDWKSLSIAESLAQTASFQECDRSIRERLHAVVCEADDIESDVVALDELHRRSARSEANAIPVTERSPPRTYASSPSPRSASSMTDDVDPRLWIDAAWVVLNSAYVAMMDHPEYLYDKIPEAPEGLNMNELNRLAREAGMTTGSVIEAPVEKQGDLDIRRWLVFYHPIVPRTVKLCVYDRTFPTVEPKTKVERAIENLRAWCDLRRDQLLDHHDGRPAPLVPESQRADDFTNPPVLLLNVMNRTATIRDRGAFPLRSAQLTFIEVLIQKDGGIVTKDDWPLAIRKARPDKIKASLPPPLKGLVLSTRGPRGGYRLSVSGHVLGVIRAQSGHNRQSQPKHRHSGDSSKGAISP